MHQLTKLDRVINLPNLGIYHFKVEEKDGKMIYDRKMIAGSGPSLYGIEVCKAMGMSSEFIREAMEIRRSIEDTPLQLVPYKASKYNSEVIIDLCQLCGNKAEHVHHIKFQKDADSNGFIGSIHKNTKSNLVTLCQSCHQEIHSGSIQLKGYKLTDSGKEIIQEKTD